MLHEDTRPTEEQLNNKDWLMKEIEDHEIECECHRLKALAYKNTLSKLLTVDILQRITQ